MQTIVIIQILTNLLIKRKMTRSQLCEKFELSPRTITRYIEVLAHAGVPIESRTGEKGGYYLPDHYKIERHSFSESELNRIAYSLKKTESEFSDDINANIIKAIKYDE